MLLELLLGMLVGIAGTALAARLSDASGAAFALAPPMLLDAWNASMTAVLRAHLRTRETLAVMVAMQLTHLALMGPLMSGWGPIPALGLPSYALAVVVARLLAIGLHLWLWRQRLNLRPRWSDIWRLPRAELAEVARIGLPGAAENVAYRLGFMVSVAVVGTLGAAALATHAYAQQVIMVVLLFGLATGLSVEVLGGHLIGAGQLRQAHHLVRRALARGLAVSVVVATAAALLGPWVLRLFTQDPDIIHAAAVLLWWTVLLEPGCTFNLVVINALRAAGDARFPAIAGALSMLSVLGLGLVGVWIAYIADEWIRGLIMWRRWATLAWVPHARESHRRLRPTAV